MYIKFDMGSVGSVEIEFKSLYIDPLKCER